MRSYRVSETGCSLRGSLPGWQEEIEPLPRPCGPLIRTARRDTMSDLIHEADSQSPQPLREPAS